MEVKNKERFSVSSFSLHILAMALMLCDHLWATLLANQEWLSAIGRMAFPIFAFLSAEGFRRTKNFKKYALRLLVAATISEVPFDLMYGGTPFDPFHQNVIWTFLLAHLCMFGVRAVEKRGKLVLTVIAGVLISLAGWLVGTLLMVDYGGEGVLTVLLFFFFTGERPWQKLCQVISMAVIHCYLIGGLTFSVTLFSHTVELPEQGLALLSLIPIWFYRGKQGPHNRGVRALFYGFYPVHMLILALLMLCLYK